MDARSIKIRIGYKGVFFVIKEYIRLLGIKAPHSSRTEERRMKMIEADRWILQIKWIPRLHLPEEGSR